MRCATCGREATGLVSMTSNVHEGICASDAKAWETHARAHVSTTRPGAVLAEFRRWQMGRERRAA